MKQKKSKRLRQRYVLIKTANDKLKYYKMPRHKVSDFIIWCYKNGFSPINTQSALRKDNESIQPTPFHL